MSASAILRRDRQRNAKRSRAEVQALEESSERRGKRILRPKEAQKRLGIGHTNFWENFVQTGRLRLVRLGPRSVGVIEHELDALIDKMVRERDLEVA
jgi:predicted DNA-binding transcriptional regulator AlpA